MSSKKRVTGFIAALVLLGSVISILLQCRSNDIPAPSTKEWFYDLNAKKLYEAPRGSIPPLAAPSGPLTDGTPAGVRAYVYGCGGCSEGKRYIGYLETFDPEDKQKFEAQQRQHTQLSPDGRAPNMAFDAQRTMQRPNLLRRPNDKEWVGIDSAEGRAIVDEALRHCTEGVYPRPCQPKN